MNRSFKVLMVFGFFAFIFLQGCFLDVPKELDPTKQTGDISSPVIPAGMIFWNKLGSLSEVNNSVAGNGGQVFGAVTYTAAKFGNGLTCDANGKYALVKFASSSNSIFKGTVEFWFKPNFNMVNGVPSAGIGDVPFFINTNTSAGSGYVYLVFHSTYKFYFDVASADGAAVTLADSTTDWTAGDLVHIAVVWDAAGFSGGKTMAIFVNGTMTASTTTSLPFVNAQYINSLVIGNNTSHDRAALGTIDNFKIYNYAKTDFSDRNVE